ncbi:hypothetical protein TNCV_2794231 [Trichonephila clavipes]|nr:hypothetical protein TNCV_2794231 [Trichonephila clavipes]
MFANPSARYWYRPRGQRNHIPMEAKPSLVLEYSPDAPLECARAPASQSLAVKITHYPVGIWLMASAECMGGPQAPTPQRGCRLCRLFSVPAMHSRKMWQSNLIPPQNMIPGAELVWRSITQQFSSPSPQCL